MFQRWHMGVLAAAGLMAAWQADAGQAPVQRPAPVRDAVPALLKAVGATPPASRTSGPVVALLRVSANGEVTAVTVQRGDSAMNDTVVAALRQWTFARQPEPFETTVMVNVLPLGGLTYTLPAPPPPGPDAVPFPQDSVDAGAGAAPPAPPATGAVPPATPATGSAPPAPPATGSAPPAPPATGSVPPSAASAPVRELAPLRVGGPIQAPTKLLDARPVYPPDAFHARIQGTVVIDAIIGADGSVHAARAVRGVPGLTEAALEAVGNWVFAQTLLNGTPVPLLMTVTVHFSAQ